MHATLRTFGFPETRIDETERWAVCLRRKQATLGAVVLVCKEPARAFSQVSREAFGELPEVVERLERGLARAFRFDRLNYLMLMMVDPEVHFHVVPRYAEAPTFAGHRFPDPGWPGPPDLGHAARVPPEVLERIRDHITQAL
jgi:diadenosine tetraphosphate (Ap4A) HIT family hydrolase